MQQEELYRLLRDPALYPGRPTKTTAIQTHISFVILTGRHAYKVKKPVNFGFLDFSTLKKRKHYCEQEVRLNSRLSNLYLAVVPITKTDQGIELAGKGRAVEYAVKMRQLPQATIMTEQLLKGKVTKAAITRLAKAIAGFHKSAATDKRIASFGTPRRFRINTDENFAQTKAFIGKTITAAQHSFIRHNTDRFLKNKKLFQERIREKKIRDCHGDLHSGNVFMAKKPRIFDCIEFNERFRFGDVALDVAFMAMDLDFQGRKDLSDLFVREYIRYSNDPGIVKVLDFYKCYRAYVRGKVIGFLLNDPNIGRKDKLNARRQASKYFTLANEYAQSLAPVLYLVSGLPGTGKSYEAKQLSMRIKAPIIRMDKIRKQLTKTEGKAFFKAYRGIYSQKTSKVVYRAAINEAASHLEKGRSCIIDATFQKRQYREWARAAARKTAAGFMIVSVICSERIVKKRLEQRFKRGSVSDGRWSVYRVMKDRFEPLARSEPHVTIDTSVGTTAKRDQLFAMTNTDFFSY
jgi:aminoglycoside phosphotransferase family enzyme/predicted kinase